MATMAEVVGRNIRLARRIADLSQEELGNRVGLLKQVISNIETGKRDISVPELVMVAQVVKRPILELILPGDFEEPVQLPNGSSSSDEGFLDLFDALDQVTDAGSDAELVRQLNDLQDALDTIRRRTTGGRRGRQTERRRVEMSDFIEQQPEGGTG
jgi:transcriptional regulator with XRE-family HTH domain